MSHGKDTVMIDYSVSAYRVTELIPTYFKFFFNNTTSFCLRLKAKAVDIVFHLFLYLLILVLVIINTYIIFFTKVIIIILFIHQM